MTYGDNYMCKDQTCPICLEDFEDNNDEITIIKLNVVIYFMKSV